MGVWGRDIHTDNTKNVHNAIRSKKLDASIDHMTCVGVAECVYTLLELLLGYKLKNANCVVARGRAVKLNAHLMCRCVHYKPPHTAIA